MKFQRIPILALALILLLAATGLAEPTYGSLTLSNFHFELDDAKPVDVKASVKVGCGGQLPDGPATLDFLVTGGDKRAFAGVFSLEEGLIKAALEKSKYRFEIPVKGMEDLLFSATPFSPMYSLWYVLPPELYYKLFDARYYSRYVNNDGPQPEDFEKAWDLAGRYAAYYRKYMDPALSKARDRKLFEILKPEFKGQEAVDLFGKYTKLYRYEMAYEGDALKAYARAVYEADPELKALEEDAAELAEAFGLDKKADADEAEPDAEPEQDQAGGDKADAKEAEPQDPLDRIMEETDIEKIAYVIWSDTEVVGDAASKAQKTALTLTIKDAVDEYGMPVKLEVPVSTSWQELAKGRRLGFELAYEPYPGESTKASFHAMLDVPDKTGAVVTDVKVKLDVNSEEGGVVMSAVLTGKETVDAQGVGDTIVSLKGTANEEDFQLGYAYDGTTSTPAEKSGAVTLTYSLPGDTLSSPPYEGLIRFDSLVETGPYRPADFSPYKDLQSVNPLRASTEVMEKVSGDVSGAMMQGMGVLMQTHGLSNLIGGMMGGLIPQ